MTQNIIGNCWCYIGKPSPYFRVILEPAIEGTYIFIYESYNSKFPDKDFLQGDLEDAKRFCEQEFNLNLNHWEEDSTIVKIMD